MVLEPSLVGAIVLELLSTLTVFSAVAVLFAAGLLQPATDADIKPAAAIRAHLTKMRCFITPPPEDLDNQATWAGQSRQAFPISKRAIEVES